MVINRYGEHLLGVVLSDDILIEKFFDFLRLQQVDSAEIRSFFLIGKFLFQNLRAEFDTVIADIYIICASDQFSNLILCLAAKLAAYFVVFSAWHTSTLFLSIIPSRNLISGW